MNSNGWIKVFRSMREWGWYQDVPVKTLWLHILLNVSREEQDYMGTVLPAGSFASTISRLAYETGLTDKQVRLALEKLEKTGEITTNRTNKYTVINAVKWADYQAVDYDEGKQTAGQKANEGTHEGTHGGILGGHSLILEQEEKKIRREEEKNIRPSADRVGKGFAWPW